MHETCGYCIVKTVVYRTCFGEPLMEAWQSGDVEELGTSDDLHGLDLSSIDYLLECHDADGHSTPHYKKNSVRLHVTPLVVPVLDRSKS